jgi:hypothetical protein
MAEAEMAVEEVRRSRRVASKRRATTAKAVAAVGA